MPGMLYTQYCRIETAAGGVTCTPCEFVRAAHKVLSAHGKSRLMRDVRHAWLRHGLKSLKNAKAVYRMATQ